MTTLSSRTRRVHAGRLRGVTALALVLVGCIGDPPEPLAPGEAGGAAVSGASGQSGAAGSQGGAGQGGAGQAGAGQGGAGSGGAGQAGVAGQGGGAGQGGAGQGGEAGQGGVAGQAGAGQSGAAGEGGVGGLGGAAGGLSGASGQSGGGVAGSSGQGGAAGGVSGASGQGGGGGNGCADPTPDLCSGTCTDTRRDETSCGSCGVVCAACDPLKAPCEVCVPGGCEQLVEVQRGDYHSCALFTSGAVRCWGSNSYGQLGDGTKDDMGETERAGKPVAIDGVTAIGTGENVTCAISAGELRCWGSNADGHLGLGTFDSTRLTTGADAVVKLGGAKPVAVAVGDSNACALLEGGAVRCWGPTSLGRLGNKAAASTFGPALGDNDVPDQDTGNAMLGAKATQISVGDRHACALLEGGAVRCWGRNLSGQLGLGSTSPVGDDENPSSVAPVALNQEARQVVAFGNSTCALLVNGEVHCWGANESGQLGLKSITPVGDKVSSSFAADTLVPNLTAVALAGHGSTVCALLGDGNVRCWGDGTSGKLGLGQGLAYLGDDEAVTDVAPITLGARVLAIAVGNQAVCARLETGNVKCWGQGTNSQLGYPFGSDAIGDDEPAAQGDTVF